MVQTNGFNYTAILKLKVTYQTIIFYKKVLPIKKTALTLSRKVLLQSRKK